MPDTFTLTKEEHAAYTRLLVELRINRSSLPEDVIEWLDKVLKERSKRNEI